MNLKYIINFTILFLICCVPPEDMEDTSLTQEEREARNKECDIYLSFATTNYQNRDFVGAVENYSEVINMGCGKRNAMQIYQWMGRAYIELNKLDSASYIFKQGLKYTPSDLSLLEVTAWNEGKMGNTENQIYYYEKMLEFDDTNLSIYKLLSDIYREEERYDDQLEVLNRWLSLDKTNKIAIGEKKAAYIALGKDVSDVDRQRWEKDPSNIQYGLEYVGSLINNDKTDEALDILLELKSYDRYNKKILEKIGSIYLDNSQNDLALDIYSDLYKIDKNYKTAIEISKILIDQEDYIKALEWAEKAVEKTGENGESLFQRAEVYFSIADDCSGESLNFNDKIVYEIAYEDYSKAINKGFYRAKVRRDFLKENNITSKGDWFMLGDEKSAKPEGKCYNWINRKVTRK